MCARSYHQTLPSLLSDFDNDFDSEYANDSEHANDSSDDSDYEYTDEDLLAETESEPMNQEFMALWNRHVIGRNVAAIADDSQMVAICQVFLTENAREIFEKNMIRDFFQHIHNMFELGLMSPIEVYQTVQNIAVGRTAYEVAVENAENHENDIGNDDEQSIEDEDEHDDTTTSEDDGDDEIAFEFNGLDINNNPIEVDINNNIPLVDDNNNDL